MAHPGTTDRPPAPTPKSGSNGVVAAARIGPHPGFISSSNQYSSEIKVRRMLKDNGCDPAREDNYRLQGVQLIDNVREYLQLPVRTFDTACTYYHKFRLNFRDAEYNYQDAALASLFVACKVEDTIKKSRDILAAAYNIKNTEKPLPPDDKVFESTSKVIIGLERLILETIGFDFRTRYPQKLLTKVVRRIIGTGDNARAFFDTAYTVCTDMYKTFIPIKRTTFAMVMGVVHLTALMRGKQEDIDGVHAFADAQGERYAGEAVMETMLDLLDLYVQHHKATKIGTSSAFDGDAFMAIKIKLNADLEESMSPRHLFHCHRCEVEEAHPLSSRTATDPVNASTAPWPADAAMRRTARGQDGTMRFVFDPDAAKAEQDTVNGYFNDDFEEVTVEEDEEVSPPPARDNNHHHHRGGRGPYRGGYRDRGDYRRGGGPYGGYRGDRPRGGSRGRYHY